MSELKIFKHKPIQIKAVQYTGENIDFINKCFGDLPWWPLDQILPGEWIVRQADGGFSIWHDKSLKETYEKVEE